MSRSVLIVLVGLSGATQAGSAVRRAPGTVVTVKLVDVSPTEYRFEPAELTVHRGDTVRFEQAGQMPHNVEFRDVPAGTVLGQARMGPYLTVVGQTYDLVIDARFAPGLHKFICTPHETLGMRGRLTVVVP